MVLPLPRMWVSTPLTDTTGRLKNGLKHAPAASPAENPSVEGRAELLRYSRSQSLLIYRSWTSALEKLSLGHEEFYSYIGYTEKTFYERVSLHHLAAFCSMLRSIKEVNIGTIDGLTLEERPRTEWACVRVESLSISHHADVYWRENLPLLLLGLEIYFPNSGLAKHSLYRKEYMFDRAN
jgi:hypothetical protein